MYLNIKSWLNCFLSFHETFHWKKFLAIKSDQVYSNTGVSTQVNTSQHEFDTNQHESDTSQHESDTSLHESYTSPTRVNTSPKQINTSLKQVLITKDRINMAKQNPNVTYQWCFLEKYVESCICQWFKFFPPIYFKLYRKILFFYKGI